MFGVPVTITIVGVLIYSVINYSIIILNLSLLQLLLLSNHPLVSSLFLCLSFLIQHKILAPQTQTNIIQIK